MKCLLTLLFLLPFIDAQDAVKITPQAGATDPKKFTAKVGSSVELECVVADGDPVEWRHAGMKITQDDRVKIHVTSDKKKSHLRISNVNKNDKGDYNCVLDALTQATIKLVVQEGKQLKIEPSDHHVEVTAGGSVRLTCTGSSSAQIAWDKDGRDVTTGPSVTINEQGVSGRVNSMLTIDSFAAQQAGHYCCYDVSMNEDGSAIVHVDAPGKHGGEGHGAMSKARCRQQSGGHDGHKGHRHTSGTSGMHYQSFITAFIPLLAFLYR